MVDDNSFHDNGPATRGTGSFGARLRTVSVLLVASFLVGAVLTLAGISPIELWESLARGIYELAERFLDTGWSTVRTALIYIAVGAVIVVPVWAVVKLFSLRK
ncbi:DUF6460 domain-containing protein [Parvularcula sp. IMCC14364]|uniref:DUF6460 domain-containing protein n=1 Tax=Parvularcula sp. IMCC14364 TaxID=3067902 RepID=UPI002740A2E8|nr:DUF6460 domain-containing protein [Parvularcula sp. IMCC14364]